MNKTQKIIIGLIQKEIDWCERNAGLTHIYERGFIEGLKQAKFLAEEFTKFNPYIFSVVG